MRAKRPEHEIERLRALRVRPERDVSIGREVERSRRELVKQRRAVGGLQGAWEELAPPELAPVARIEKLTAGGILVIAARDAAAAYSVDVWLRSGGDAKLRARCERAVRSIRVKQSF